MASTNVANGSIGSRLDTQGGGSAPAKGKGGFGTLLALHLLLMVYSTNSILAKLASGAEFMSLRFVLLYGGEIFLLGVYAIGWQQVIKRMPLSVAYANKAVTLVWGIIWGALVFHEGVTPLKLVGAAIVLAGVVLYSLEEARDAGEPEDDDANHADAAATELAAPTAGGDAA